MGTSCRPGKPPRSAFCAGLAGQSDRWRYCENNAEEKSSETIIIIKKKLEVDSPTRDEHNSCT